MTESIYKRGYILEIDQISSSRIIDTNYCSAIRSLQDLFFISKFIQSRVTSDITDPQTRGKSVAHAIEQTLGSTIHHHSGQEDITEIIDENGKRLIFLSLLTPYSKDRSKLAEDDDGNLVPVIISMLLPDRKFNLSELAVIYDINLEDCIIEQFGPDYYMEHVTRYKDSLYIDISATYYVLSRYQPFLLIALAFSVFLHSTDQAQKLKSLLLNLGEELRRLEDTIIDNTFTDNPISYEEVGKSVKHLLESTEDYLTDLLGSGGGHEEGEELNWHEFHIVYQAFEMLISDEKYYFYRHFHRQESYPSETLALQNIRERVRKIRRRIYFMRITIP